LWSKNLADLAVAHRLPAVAAGPRAFVEAGGLMSYGADSPSAFRRSAVFVDKILKGSNPADLPMEQPTKFELGINLVTARAIGLTIPDAFLQRADVVID
jgi:putative ABC transport system substrate-binding protein